MSCAARPRWPRAAGAADLVQCSPRPATCTPRSTSSNRCPTQNADAQGRADTLAAAQLAQMSMGYGDAAAWAKALVERDPADLDAAGLLATLVLWTDGPDAARAVGRESGTTRRLTC